MNPIFQRRVKKYLKKQVNGDSNLNPERKKEFERVLKYYKYYENYLKYVPNDWLENYVNEFRKE